MASRTRAASAASVWHSLFRIGLGAFWLYFAAQKWPPPVAFGSTSGIGWMHPLMEQAAKATPIPPLHDALTSLVLPNWTLFATAQAVGETAVAVLLILGLATRPAAVVAVLLALNLSLTVAFTVPDIGVRWLYYMPVLAGMEVLVNGSGALAVDRAAFVPRWLRA